MKILIADDARLSRSYIKRILSVSGFGDEVIIEVNNGSEALSALESNADIKCLFLDINMPVMTGTELIDELWRRGTIHNVDIVITSSIADHKFIDELKSKGIKFFLRKPFSPESLSEITEMLKGKAA